MYIYVIYNIWIIYIDIMYICSDNKGKERKNIFFKVYKKPPSSFESLRP